jgi:two-component system response regulator DesR
VTGSASHAASGPAPSKRVLVIDGHRLYAESLALALGQLGGVDECTSVSSVDLGVIELDDDAPYDVVVLDGYVVGRSGIDGTVEIRRRWPDTRIVMVTAEPELDLLAEAAVAGVDAFLAKDASFAEVSEAVLSGDVVDLGESGFLARVAESIRVREVRRESSEAPIDLTPRERDVLSLLAQGVAMKDMAGLLGITVETCRGYVKTLLLKLDARSQLQAVVIAARKGLLDDESPLADDRGDQDAARSRSSSR